MEILIYNTKTKKTVLGTYYGDNLGLQLFEIDINDQTCRNIYQDLPFGNIINVYTHMKGVYLYLYMQNNSSTLNPLKMIMVFFFIILLLQLI